MFGISHRCLIWGVLVPASLRRVCLTGVGPFPVGLSIVWRVGEPVSSRSPPLGLFGRVSQWSLVQLSERTRIQLERVTCEGAFFAARG